MGIAHDEGADPAGMGEGPGERGPAAHRLGDEADGLAGRGGIEEGGEVLGEGARARFGGVLGRGGEAAVGEGEAAVAGREEGGDLLPP